MLDHSCLSYTSSKDPSEESLEVIFKDLLNSCQDPERFSKILFKDVIKCHLLTLNMSQVFTLLCKHLR